MVPPVTRSGPSPGALLYCALVSDRDEQNTSLQVHDLTPLEFFDGYSPKELKGLIPYLKRYTYDPEDGPIFHEDLARKGIQLILEGEVRIVKIVSEDHGLLLATLRRGEIFGEASMFDRGPHTSTVDAAEITETAAITRETYHERLVKERPDLAEKIARKAAQILSERLRQANETVMTYAIWSRSLQQAAPPTRWRWYPLSTTANLQALDLDESADT